MKDEAKKPKRGRPTKITVALEKALWAEIADGSTTREACRRTGISYSSVAVKLANDAEFRDRRARAYLHGTVFYLDDAEEGLRTATPENISVRREIAHHARWRASKMLPAFSDKLNLQAEVTTSDGPMDRLETARRMIHFIKTTFNPPPDPSRADLPHDAQVHVAEFAALPQPQQPVERQQPEREPLARPEDDDDCSIV